VSVVLIPNYVWSYIMSQNITKLGEFSG
jgi:hypothetical protein